MRGYRSLYFSFALAPCGAWWQAFPMIEARRWNVDSWILPIGSIVAPFEDYFIGSYKQINKQTTQKELLWSLWVLLELATLHPNQTTPEILKPGPERRQC